MTATDPTTFAGQHRQTLRRVARQERRPQVSVAADLMGPGLAPKGIQVSDWSDDVMAFNGIYYSAPGAINSPDSTKAWIGWCTVDQDGSGVQTVTQYVTAAGSLGAWSPVRKARAFVSPDGTTRVFSTWQTV